MGSLTAARLSANNHVAQLAFYIHRKIYLNEIASGIVSRTLGRPCIDALSRLSLFLSFSLNRERAISSRTVDLENHSNVKSDLCDA